MYVTLLTYFFRRCEFWLTMPIVPRVSYRGGAWNSLPPLPLPEILKLSMVINALSQVLNNNLVPDCVRSNLRGSKFLWEHAPHTPLVGTHAYVCVEVLSHTTIILLPPCFPPPPPPPKLKILYGTIFTYPSLHTVHSAIPRNTESYRTITTDTFIL